METMQTAILNALQEVPKEANSRRPRKDRIEVRQAASFANVGRLYYQVGFRTLLDLSYDFQASSAQILFANVARDELIEPTGYYGPATRPSDGGPWKGWQVKYNEGEVIEQVLANVRHILARSLPPVIEKADWPAHGLGKGN